ncbi:hypothetical protein ABWK39_00990 [Bacillus toyonensis]|uniref:hypothetical protein n=1 Tax=Bacillus toyonensis TaxID=155322 RepID=UPI00339888FA
MIKIKGKHFPHKKEKYYPSRQNNVTQEKLQTSKDDCGCDYGNSPDSLPVDLPTNNCKENPWQFPPK